jgi:hypothetical protein
VTACGVIQAIGPAEGRCLVRSLFGLVLLTGCGAAAAVGPPASGAETGRTDASTAEPPTVASEPPSERFEIAAEDPCLPAELDAILLETSSGRGVVDPGDGAYAIGGSTVVLLPPSGRLRRIVADAGVVVAPEVLHALGAAGPITLAHVVLDDDRGCVDAVGTPAPIRVVSLERPIALPPLATLADAVLASGSTDRAALVEAARHALDAVAPGRAASGAVPHGERQLLAWSARPTATGGELLLLVRVQRDYVREEDSDAPHAGSHWCDAPPGADCAPSCVPPRERITETFVGEAAIRVTFDATGAIVSTTSEPAGVLARPIVHSTGVGDCAH